MTVSFVAALSSQVDEGYTDPAEYIEATARRYDAAGFDQILVAWGATGIDGMVASVHAASRTERIVFLIAHRPGFVAPTVAARMFATADRLTRGRVAIHIITGASDIDQQRDGDWLAKEARYARTDAFLRVFRQVWTHSEPFNEENAFYHVAGATSQVRPYSQPHPLISFGGSSGDAPAIAARHADSYALTVGTLDHLRDQMASIRALAGRPIRFSYGIRAIAARTERAAWERARAIQSRRTRPGSQPIGDSLDAFIAESKDSWTHDGNVWNGFTQDPALIGNETTIVGTPDQVVETLLQYVDAGVDTFFTYKGGDTPSATDDALIWEEVMPRLREAARERTI